MGDYFRRDKWWEKGENMYLDNFKNEGMREVDLESVEYGDILLLKLDSFRIGISKYFLKELECLNPL